MVLVKNLKFFSIFLFVAKSASKMCLSIIIILKRKKEFLDFEIRKLKNSKNSDFSKGFSPWFWSKI